MWGHKQRTYYNFSEIIQGCGISKTGLDNCILNGTLAVHAWIPPISVFKIEESLVHNQVVLKRTEMHWEGYTPIHVADYRKILHKGTAFIREFPGMDVNQVICLKPGAVDVEVSYDDLVILAQGKETGEAPDWQRLYERRESYRIGSIPQGGLLVTAGADVQKDRIEVSIWAWGREKESWLVEHRVLDGDTARSEVWKKLDAMLAESWPHESGYDLPVRRVAIDSGYATQEVYAWARRRSQSQVMVIKGVQRGAALVGMPTAVDVTADGRKIKRGLRVRPVVGGIAKLELFNNLRKSPPTRESGDPYPAGYVHLPEVDEEYLKQLCSEQLISLIRRQLR